MSSYIFYKIPYEGSLKKVKELIEEREWDFQIKVPKDGIILVKIPLETEEELLRLLQRIPEQVKKTTNRK